MPKSAKERFDAFHKLNPQVYDQLVTLALTLRYKGQARCGIRLIWERLRWDHLMSTDDPDSSFKLNDHYKEFYARLLMKNEPDLRDFFFTRTQPRRMPRQTVELESAPTESELAMDALVGKDDFGLTELQRKALHTRLTAMESAEKTHSISFAAEPSAATWSTKCCEQSMVLIQGHKKPHEQLERCLTPACKRHVCTKCGEIK